jgi:hypothetical protein
MSEEGVSLAPGGIWQASQAAAWTPIRTTMLQNRPDPNAAAVHHERASLCQVSGSICGYIECA